MSNQKTVGDLIENLQVDEQGKKPNGIEPVYSLLNKLKQANSSEDVSSSNTEPYNSNYSSPKTLKAIKYSILITILVCLLINKVSQEKINQLTKNKPILNIIIVAIIVLLGTFLIIQKI